MDVFKHFCEEYTNHWIELQRNFEKCKREFNPDTEVSDICIPAVLDEAFKAKSLPFGIEIHPGTLRLKHRRMKTLFSRVLDETVSHIEHLLSLPELRSVKSILLVGGFSISPIVNTRIKDHFSKMKIIASGSARMATLRGAVMYGIDSRLIASRVSPYTYGVHTRRLYNKSLHPENKKKRTGGRDIVDNAFCKHIEKGENVYIGKQSNEQSYRICNRKKEDVVWKVYQSSKKTPTFCDEQGCQYVGNLTLGIPKTIKDNILNIKVYMTCRGTELAATASIEGHNYSTTAIFDFLCEDRMIVGSDEYIEAKE